MLLRAPLHRLVPGLRGRVLTALVRSRRPLRLREIARAARSSSPSSVSLILQDFVDDGMVDCGAAERGDRYFMLRRDHYLSRLMIQADDAWEAMQLAIVNVVEGWPVLPAAVVLMGPVARGDDDPGSRIDLLLVWSSEPDDPQSAVDSDLPGCDSDDAPDDVRDRLDEQEGACAELVAMVHGWTGNPVQVAEFEADEWLEVARRQDPIVYALLREGVRIFGTHPWDLVRTSRVSAQGRPGES